MNDQIPFDNSLIPALSRPTDPTRDEMIRRGYLTQIEPDVYFVDLERFHELVFWVDYLERCKCVGTVTSVSEYVVACRMVTDMQDGKPLSVDHKWTDTLFQQINDVAKYRGLAIVANEDEEKGVVFTVESCGEPRKTSPPTLSGEFFNWSLG